MKVLVVGGGGREHAIVQKLRQSPRVSQLYALPGNGGMASDATLVPIGAKDIDAMVAFAKEKGIDFVVVAPDDPLALGAVDALKQAGIACFGPDKKAAEIESSKVFAKRLMKKYGIPTAAFEVFDDEAQALAYLDTAPIPTVIKADGLAHPHRGDARGPRGVGAGLCRRQDRGAHGQRHGPQEGAGR